MSHTLEEIRSYWNSRAEGYTQSNREELEGESNGPVVQTPDGELCTRTGCWLRTWIFLCIAGKDGP